MSLGDAHVRPPVQRLTDDDARRLLSHGLIPICADHGPKRVAFDIGCEEKTVRRARDRESTLGLASVLNLLDVDSRALDALLAAKGVRVVPLEAICTSDAIVTQSAAIHRLAEARSPYSPGGTAETDCELIGMEGEVDAAMASLGSMKARIIRAKLARAAA